MMVSIFVLMANQIYEPKDMLTLLNSVREMGWITLSHTSSFGQAIPRALLGISANIYSIFAKVVSHWIILQNWATKLNTIAHYLTLVLSKCSSKNLKY